MILCVLSSEDSMLGSQRKWADYSKGSTVSHGTHLGLLLAWCKRVTFSQCVLLKLKKKKRQTKNAWTRTAVETGLLLALVFSPVLSSLSLHSCFNLELNYIEQRQNCFSLPSSSHSPHDLFLLKIAIYQSLFLVHLIKKIIS